MQHLDEGTIHAWLDGELPPAEAEAAEVHVATCDECRAAVAEARGFIAGSSRILLALDAVPGGVLPASTTSTSTSRVRAPKRFTISRAWMAAAAVLVLSTATVIAVRPKRDVSIATVAARDEATSLRADSLSAPSAVASAPMVAAAPEPSSAPGAKASTNAPLANAQGAMAPREQKDLLRKKAERQPMIVAQAPAASQSESAKSAAQTGDPGASASRARAADAMMAQAPAPVAAPAPSRDAASNGGVPITGRVLSEAGAPLGSASVVLEGTGIATLTHDDGHYALTVPASRVDGKTRSLVARLIGYKAGVAPIVAGSDSITHDFVLVTNPLTLSEIVVTGEGTSTSAEKLGSTVNALDSNKVESLQSAPIRSRGTRVAGKGQRSGIFLASGAFAELTSHTSSGESGEPVDISIYRIGGSYVTFIDRLRPDTTRATVDDTVVTKIERAYDKRGATINRLAWTDAQGRMRTLRGAVSLDLLQQLKQVLDHPMP
jgi:CarboxypepD_reg-like domain/Putative zinc-finger